MEKLYQIAILVNGLDPKVPSEKLILAFCRLTHAAIMNREPNTYCLV